VVSRARRPPKSLKTKILNIKYLKQQQTRARGGGQKSGDIDFSFSIKKNRDELWTPKTQKGVTRKKRTNPQKGHVLLSQTIKYSHRNAQDVHRPTVDGNRCMSLPLLLRTILGYL